MIQGKSQVNLIRNQHQNYRPFWASRDLRGDPFASTALDVVYNRDLGMIANALSPMNNEQLGVNLMVSPVLYLIILDCTNHKQVHR
jgi:hypothetical protein